MKIAIYHGFLVIHYEMIPYLIDYFKYMSSKITINYYVNDLQQYYSGGKFTNIEITAIYNQWISHYKQLDNDINISSITTFNPKEYDLIYLVTDDDESFLKDWFIDYSDKIVSIKHCQLDRTPPVYENVNTRYIFNKIESKWVLPIYNAITKYDKYNLINKSNKIKVLCIGKILPESYIYLLNIFDNFDDIEFNIVTLSYSYIYNYDMNKLKHPNINIYIDLNVDDMLTLLKESSYIMIFQIYNCVDNSNYDRLCYITQSGIHLGLSYNCKLILPSEYNKYYSLQDAVLYNQNVSASIFEFNNNKKIKLEKITPDILCKTYNQMYELINHRNVVFDKIIINKNKNIYNNSPKVYITFDEDFINNNALNGNIFREKYWITDTFYNNNIETINNINFIYKINEPVLFIFKYNDNLKDRLMLLNNRQYCDFIIIYMSVDEYNMSKNEITNYYTKMPYIEYNDTRLIIISHK